MGKFDVLMSCNFEKTGLKNICAVLNKLEAVIKNARSGVDFIHLHKFEFSELLELSKVSLRKYCLGLYAFLLNTSWACKLSHLSYKQNCRIILFVSELIIAKKTNLGKGHLI